MIKHLDGLPITALCRPVNQCDLFKSAGWIPLSAFVRREQTDPCKKGLVVFGFHVVGLEGESPNLAIHLIKAWMFFNATTRSS
jgi:hypothetical protein